MRPVPQAALEWITDGVVRQAGATPATRFLEPGIGTGRIAAPLVRRGYQYVGLDPSAPMLRVRPNLCPVVQGDVRAMPFAAHAFDVVLTAHVLYLVEGWRSGLAEIRRVLRPGGRYLHCFERSADTPAARVLAERWQAAVGPQSWPTAVTDDEILDALRQGGARVESHVVANWSRVRSLEDFLAGYETKMRPLYPELDENHLHALVQDFTAWARRVYPFGAEVGHDIHFEIHTVRWE